MTRSLGLFTDRFAALLILSACTVITPDSPAAVFIFISEVIGIYPSAVDKMLCQLKAMLVFWCSGTFS